MRPKTAMFIAAMGLGISLSYPLFAQTASAEAILRKAEQSVYPDTFTMDVTLRTLDSGSVESTIQMRISYKRNVGTRIELLSPPRSRGIRFLQKGSNLWMFNPEAGTSRPIRLSAAAPFQGSVFNNGDLSDPQYSEQYNVRVEGTQTINQPGIGTVRAVVIEGTARNARVPYSKVKLWVRSSDDMFLRGDYYAKSGLLFKTMVCTRIREMAGAERPTVLTMRSMDQKNRESVMTIRQLSRAPSLPDAIFTLSALTR